MTVSLPTRSLPDFPWDRLVPYSTRAREHAGGIVDLSVGTPVDPTPEIAQQALAEASNAPGYPFTAGTQAVRDAAADLRLARFECMLKMIDWQFHLSLPLVAW